jgi:hypothetical protein
LLTVIKQLNYSIKLEIIESLYGTLQNLKQESSSVMLAEAPALSVYLERLPIFLLTFVEVLLLSFLSTLLKESSPKMAEFSL